MGREIKFRAFDGVDYVTKPFTLLDIQSGKIQFASSDTVIMQFTGLHDTNGVEIYEGDRVRFLHIDKLKGHVDAYEGAVGYDDEDAGFYILNDSDRYPHVKFWYAENIEVIGNIYEPPLSDHIDKHGGPY